MPADENHNPNMQWYHGTCVGGSMKQSIGYTEKKELQIQNVYIKYDSTTDIIIKTG